MSSKRLCKWCFIVGGLLLSQWTLDSAMGQWSPVAARPVRSLDRWLGIGYSAGYHWRNPGPNTDYYHPYSDLHSRYSDWDTPLDMNPPMNSLPVEEPAPLQQPGGSQSSRPRQQPILRAGNSPGFGWGPPGKSSASARNASRDNPSAAQRR